MPVLQQSTLLEETPYIVLNALQRQEESFVLYEKEPSLSLRVGVNHKKVVGQDIGPQRKVDEVDAFLYCLHCLLFFSMLKANSKEKELEGELFESAICVWTEQLMFSGAAR